MAIRLKHSSGAPLLRPSIKSDSPDSSVSLTGGYNLVSGAIDVEVVDEDAVFDEYTSASYYYDGDLRAINMRNVVYVSLDPSIATVDSQGVVTRVSEGVCRFLIKGDVTFRVDVDLTTKTDLSVVTVFNSVVTGSLAAHLIDQVDSRIDDTMSMAANGVFYTTQNHVSANYIRNVNLWCGDLNLTAISPWNSTGVQKTATLITPRHAISSAHFTLAVGNTIRFVEQGGVGGASEVVHTRTITGVALHPLYTSPTSKYDLCVYTLDSDLPASITPCEVMPSDFEDYLRKDTFTRPPSLGLDQEEHGIIQDYSGQGSFTYPTDPDRFIFFEWKVSGDSSDPALFLCNNKLALITVWKYGWGGWGAPVGYYIPVLNAMIVTADTQAGVSTGYVVTEADFSAFPNFTTKNYLLGDDGAGNKSAWVENGTNDGKTSYKFYEGSVYQGGGLLWSSVGQYWQAYESVIPPEGPWVGIQIVAQSTSDVATPDLATFTNGWSFATP